jgi:hypothetical protein
MSNTPNPYPEKTPRWWFWQYFPEPYKSQAIENFDQNYFEKESGGTSASSLSYALSFGFFWETSNEGRSYWVEVSERVYGGDFSTPNAQPPTPRPDRRGNQKGSNGGGGRRKSERPINPTPYGGRLYVDQGSPSAQVLRDALDLQEAIINALGNPHFNSAEVFDALKEVALNGSIEALLNILPQLEAAAKKKY